MVWVQVRKSSENMPKRKPFGPSDIFIDDERLKVDPAIIAKFVAFIEKETGKKVRKIDIQYAARDWEYD